MPMYDLNKPSYFCHLAALFFSLQACSLVNLNKVACTTEVCVWKKFQTYVISTSLATITFRELKKPDLLPTISSDEVHIKSYFSPKPSRLPELVKNKFISEQRLQKKQSTFDDVQLDSETGITDQHEHETYRHRLLLQVSCSTTLFLEVMLRCGIIYQKIIGSIFIFL